MNNLFRRYAGIMFLILLLTACAPRTNSTPSNGGGPTATRVAPTATFVVNATFTPTVPLAPSATMIPPTATTRPPTAAPSAAASTGNSTSGSGDRCNGELKGTPLHPLEVQHRQYIEARDPRKTPQRGGVDMNKWRQGAGFTTGTFTNEPRQPLEETWWDANGVCRQWVVGFQSDANNVSFSRPQAMTVNLAQAAKGRCVIVGPDSKLCTDVQSFSGYATFYADSVVWNVRWDSVPVNTYTDKAPSLEEGQTGNVTTTGGGASAPSPSSTGAAGSNLPSDGCFTLEGLNKRYGIDKAALGTPHNDGLLYNGTTLAGAVIKVTEAQIAELEGLGWTIQGNNPNVKSAWSPEKCRPLQKGDYTSHTNHVTMATMLWLPIMRREELFAA